MVLALRQSSFCSLMAGCAKVRSPIQRTNLMMKDPNYRTCYKLWQFLEGYDDVGYAIDVQDSNLAFDEEYLFQLYTSFITSYAVFQSILEQVPRKLEEPLGKKRKVIQPKFIKKVKEQRVENRDLPDVEIRRVFVEEVTQAQLDAEEKLTQETAARQKLQSQLDELEGQLGALQRQLMALQDMNTAFEAQAETERLAKEQAQAQCEAERQALQRAEELLEAERQARTEAKSAADQARSEAALLVAKTEAAAQAAADKTKKEADRAVAQAHAQADERVKKAQHEAQAQTAKAKADAQAQIAQARNELEKARQEAEALLAKVQQTEKAMQQAEQTAQRALTAQKAAQAAAKTAQAEAKLQHRRAEKEAKARERAENRANANSLSKYIITALNERKHKDDAEPQEDLAEHENRP
jgi:hypothetical protein